MASKRRPNTYWLKIFLKKSNKKNEQNNRFFKRPNADLWLWSQWSPSGIAIVESSHPFVVVEHNPDLIKVQDKMNFIEWDARHDGILEQANFKIAKHLIAALHNEVDNLLVVLSAREFNPELLIVSRLIEDSNRS